jgi:predicted helicase
LSERRQHLADIESMIKARLSEITIGYYVGGLSQKELDISAEKQIILATYQMAAEGMNIPTLNTVIFASPISDIQQSIGRILREKPSERRYIPLCIDIWDQFSIFTRKGYSRIKYYTSNNYNVQYFINGEKIATMTPIDEDNNNVRKKYSFIQDE